MKVKSSAHYQREYRKRLRQQGFVKKEVWILPEHTKLLSAYEKKLRVRELDLSVRNERQLGIDRITNGLGVCMGLDNGLKAWTTVSLQEGLLREHLFESGRAKLQLIDGVEPALLIEMNEYGDLPIFLTVSGEQIIVEAVLWSVDEVVDVAAFNDAILRTHKYFPLSTISLDKIGDEGDYYHMFGALSSTSLLSNVVFEIEVLASNVIQATEAYSEFLDVTLDKSAAAS
ncbi:hypothetical protein A3715_04710 [Oleiphilus sp. HI0009]|uniref:YjfI family protein n=2 Tax=Oleiphilus TaxID=141450 RepID=UPI0007C23277|nr:MULTISPECIES: YjfI family protein [unclassified Oleiphilus]KZX83768.1 hypothetical protein A3715_04710 [Oleiphilus sp. HI0009]KZY66584.1 hypothetical protein A3738_16590 [Oleiphilus sp. HI0066]KZY67953.1 hypothetical protein A3739_11540 [Oleiphilus sp. HI0067]